MSRAPEPGLPDRENHLLRVSDAIGADHFDWRPRPRGSIEHTDAVEPLHLRGDCSASKYMVGGK
jgi:hypothetical protein